MKTSLADAIAVVAIAAFAITVFFGFDFADWLERFHDPRFRVLRESFGKDCVGNDELNDK